MLSLKESTKLYLAMTPVDMRKAVNGLSALVSTALCQDPQSGHLFIFYNRSRNKIKCLLWDKNQDIEETLQYLKGEKKHVSSRKILSFYRLYELYCDYAKEKPLKYIASKKYFENSLRTTIPKDYLSGDAVLADYWKL